MIFVECNPDEALVRFLTRLSRRQIIHERGKGEICNRLRKKDNSLGLVDEDPGKPQPSYIKEAKLKEDVPLHGIKVKYHESTNNYLIILCPSLEGWIIGAAKESGVDLMRSYSLPKDVNGLHSVINLNLDKYEKILGDLRGTTRFKELQKLLKRYHQTG
ncbi:MAG: hypothetical protein WC749_09370 [Dehalococcoidia bacterium]